MQSLKKIHAWAHMKVPLWTCGLGGDVIKRKKFTDGWTTHNRRPITIAHLEPWAQVS